MKRKPERFLSVMIVLLFIIAALWSFMLGYVTGEAKVAQRLLGDGSIELISLLDATGFATDSSTLTVFAGGSFLLTLLLAAMLSRRVYTLAARCRERVNVREQALEAFNASVDEQVETEVRKQRQSEKMLIQHAKMSAIAEVLAMISERWQTPVREASKALQALESKPPYRHADDGRAVDPVDEARQMLDALMQTIDEYHACFRLDKTREQIDMGSLITQARGLVEAAITQRGISIRTHVDTTLTLSLYRNELIHVLINLLQNAAEALSDAAVAQPHIGIECYETGQYVVIRICDNGGGVDEQTASQMFEPYFTTKVQGSGIGLYLSRIIVEEHFNGQLLFENSDDGACFFVKIGKHQ